MLPLRLQERNSEDAPLPHTRPDLYIGHDPDNLTVHFRTHVMSLLTSSADVRPEVINQRPPDRVAPLSPLHVLQIIDLSILRIPALRSDHDE